MAKGVKTKDNPLIVEAAAVQEDVSQQAALAHVWERRLVNPGQRQGPDIGLKTPGFELHWVDSSRPGRFHMASREQGWVPVRPDELEDTLENLGLTDQKDGKVRRGPKGEEILFKMPKKVFARIRKRKAEVVMQGLRKTRTKLATAAANRFGTEQAAEFVLGKGDVERDGTGGLKGTILDKIGEDAIESQ